MPSLATSAGRRSKLAVSGFFAAVILLFLAANKAAYRGYFQDDDFATVSWNYWVPFQGYVRAWLTPIFSANNFRPSGFVYYYVMTRLAGLNYPPYVAVIHALHFLNIALLWLLLRKLGLGRLGAAAGALFFAFDVAVFDVYWKPMYVFDLICALFCLLSLLAYTHKRWILSFLCFWFAYKAKEVAIVLPAVLACYEFWLGERRWKRLIPFFAVSLSFGVQALIHNRGVHGPYRLSFHSIRFWKTLCFYSSEILLAPYVGFLLLLAAFLKDRRAYFGLAALGLFLAPMLFVPGRVFAAYLYVPLIGCAIVAAAIASRVPVAAVALFFAAWLPYNYVHLREKRGQALVIAAENRAYVAALAGIAPCLAGTRPVVIDGRPSHMHLWGPAGALGYLIRKPGMQVRDAGDLDRKNLPRDPFVLLSWNPDAHRIYMNAWPPSSVAPSYIPMDHAPFFWFGDGWWDRTGGFRWIGPQASVRIWRPRNARQFELVVNAGSAQIEKLRRFTVAVFCEGRLLGKREFTRPGWQTARWDLSIAPAGLVDMEFRVSPEFHPGKNDPRTLGAAIADFGFLPRQQQPAAARCGD